MDFSGLAACAEISAEHVEAAVASRDAMRKLLARVAMISHPDEGCPKVLMIVGRLARGGVEWVSGQICAELTGDEGSTLFTILEEAGFGLFEPLFPALRLDAPLDEFQRAARLAPKMFAPLVAENQDGKLLLSPPIEGARTPAQPAVDFDLDDPFAEPTQPSTAPAAAAPAAPRSPGPAAPAAPRSPAPAAAPAAPAPAPRRAAPTVHTRPTVRRMVAIDPAMFGVKTKDPRRDDD